MDFNVAIEKWKSIGGVVTISNFLTFIDKGNDEICFFKRDKVKNEHTVKVYTLGQGGTNYKGTITLNEFFTKFNKNNKS